MAIFSGLASAACWGAGDFSGGYATRRSSVYSVIILSQLAGGILLLILALASNEPLPDPVTMLLGSLAGMAGAMGLVALYLGLAVGQMGVVASVAALVSASLPVLFGIFMEGFPQPGQLIGFLFAFLAVWFLSRGDNTSPVRFQDLKLPLAAGVGFAGFFILIDQVSHVSLLWPLVSARVVSVLLIFSIALVRRGVNAPAKGIFLLIVLAGIFDTGGNAFYALATRAGRLDTAAVLASLYPAVTVLLAWVILKEKLTHQQWIGVASALIALPLIAF